MTGKFFFAKLFELMDWNIDYRYKLIGKVIHANDEYLIVFDLNASEIYQRIAKRRRQAQDCAYTCIPSRLEGSVRFALS